MEKSDSMVSVDKTHNESTIKTKGNKKMEKIIEKVTSKYSQDPKTKKIEKVAAYVRVSTQEQKLHGLSLDAQKQKLQEYADKHGLKIVEWYIDEGVSGRKLIRRRPELQRMIHDAEEGNFDRIIFIKLDRFFRSIAEYHECMKLIDPVIWTATEEKYDLSTANGRAFVNMKLTIAELEADQTGERIDLVNEYKVKTGQPLTGSVPFCLTILQVGDRKRIVKNPETADIMEDLLKHIWTHQSKSKAVKYINAKYNMDMAQPSLTKLLKNTMLYGEYRGNPNYITEENRYMTKAEFDKMQNMLKRQVKDNSTKHDYIFSGLIKCPECGKLLKGTMFTGKTAKGERIRYYKYRCQKHSLRGTCSYNKVVNEVTVEKLMLENIESILEDAKIKSAEIVESIPENNEMEIKELQAELDRLNYSWQKGRIKDVEKYDREYDELTEKIEAAQNKQVEIVKQDFSKAEAALADGWKSIYETLDNSHKRAFWRSFIESIEIDWSGHRQRDKRITRINFF